MNVKGFKTKDRSMHFEYESDLFVVTWVQNNFLYVQSFYFVIHSFSIFLLFFFCCCCCCLFFFLTFNWIQNERIFIVSLNINSEVDNINSEIR